MDSNQTGENAPHTTPPSTTAFQRSYAEEVQRKRRWWIWPLTITGSVIAGMLLMVMIIVLGIAGLISAASESGLSAEKQMSVKENSVLILDFGSGGLQEYVAQGGLFDDLEKSTALIDVVEAIRYAKTDSHIVGIYFKPSGSVGFAKQREVLDALRDFKGSKKFIYAFLPGGNESDYAFAAVADSIFMPQEANFEMNGFGGASPFLKDMFEKIGVRWTVIQREDYKSAGEMYSRTSYSEPARKEIHELLDARYAAYVTEVAKDRGMRYEDLDAALRRGVYTADSMKALGFIDAFATELQVKESLKQRVNGGDASTKKLNSVSLHEYVRYARAHAPEAPNAEKNIAIVYGSGAIRSGKTSPLELEIASGSWVRDLRKAADDESVKAIILRIDSPGGSVQASDEMYQEILRAKKKKPVYASMSDVAASGGYYMSMACDTIIAHPQTITGSIGVIAAIPNFSKTMTMIGVSMDTVSTGPAATFMNPLLPMSDKDRATLENFIDGTYNRFLERVAAGRRTTKDAVREVAKGRVWTGTQAQAKGLVDVLGGLNTAIDIAKARIGVAKNTPVRIVRYPEKKDPFKALLTMISNKDDDEAESEDAQAALKSQVLRAMVNEFVSQQPNDWQIWWKSLPPAAREEAMFYLNLAMLSNQEHVLAVLPWSMATH